MRYVLLMVFAFGFLGQQLFGGLLSNLLISFAFVTLWVYTGDVERERNQLREAARDG